MRADVNVVFKAANEQKSVAEKVHERRQNTKITAISAHDVHSVYNILALLSCYSHLAFLSITTSLDKGKLAPFSPALLIVPIKHSQQLPFTKQTNKRGETKLPKTERNDGENQQEEARMDSRLNATETASSTFRTLQATILSIHQSTHL